MEGKWLRSVAAACFAGLAVVSSARAQDEGSNEVQIESVAPAPDAPVIDSSGGVSVRDQLRMVPKKPGIRPKRITVGAANTAATAGTERLVYSNTLGKLAVEFGANRLLSDDLTITSTGRNDTQLAPITTTCTISKIAFEVDGRVEENLPGGAYTVSWALYNTCPYAVSPGPQRNSRIIPGSAGSLDVTDDSPMWIEFVPETTVNAYTNMWLGVSFSRENVGMIAGNPAMIGHTGDTFDFPGSACIAGLGGFPAFPHASFNIEIWGHEATCPQAYVAYRNLRESGAGANHGSSLEFLTDDITMQNACMAKGYTVAVRAPGTYNFELRATCGSGAIAGTAKRALVGQSSGQEPRVFEFLFDNPVNLSQGFNFAVNINNPNGGAIVTGSQATIGSTEDFFERTPNCVPEDLRVGQLDALQLSVICDGPAPVGACCDMFITECKGGLLNGELCTTNADCQPVCSQGFCSIGGVALDPPVACTNNNQCTPGTCEPPCREIPQNNCPFPPRFTTLLPPWNQGKLCANDNAGPALDPFPGIVCGQAACCYEDTQEILRCTNLTRTVCDQQQPTNQPRDWQPGHICGLGAMCPIIACLGRTGDCYGCPHEQGCTDAQCCTEVCAPPLGDDFCCFLEWDCFCRDRAVEVCGELTRPTNDTCGPAPQNRNAGAQLITIPFTAKIPTPAATAIDTLDPPACCHNGLPLGCDSGTKVNQTCVEDDDCIDAFSPDAKCLPRPPQPYFSLWYKFVATTTSLRIHTCDSSSEDATDSLIQLFAVGDPNADTDEEACASLFPIACSDDAGTSGANGCSGDPLLSNMCAEGLIVGEPYYLMVATKSFDTVGEYRFTIGTTACTNAGSVPNDWCNRGTVVTDGPPKDPELVPFNMTGSTLNCPGPTCVESVDKDLWYDYTATCTGPATIGCHGGNPATNLIIYDGCECPGLNEEPLACTNEVPPLACGEVTFNVVAGKCYKIRLGNENANTPTGTLAIACDGTGCPPGAVSFFEPLNGTVDAGIPTAPDNAAELEGIQTIKVMAPVSLEAPEACFAIDCETEPFGGDPNAILDVVEEPGQPGTYTIALARPISPYAVTRIRYLGSAPGPTTRAPYTGHPCNVDGDFGVVADTDVGLLVDVLEGLAADPPFNVFVQWGDYGTDVDRSSDTTALDLVMLMDLFNGAGAFESCDNTLRPSAASCPP